MATGGLDNLGASTSPLAAFREGFATPWDGFRHMARHPGLWRYGVLPVVLNLLITGLLLVLLVSAAVYFATTIHPWFADGWLWCAAEILAVVAILVVALVLTFLAWTVLQGVLCGHFYGKLAEQVELQLGMRPDEIKDVPFAHQVADTAGDVGFLILVNAGFFALQIIPVLGTIVGTAGSYYYTCMTLGTDFLEHPLALRGMRRQERRRFARQHRAHTLGLGTAVALIALVPVVNAVLLTTAVTGAVLLHRRLTLGYSVLPLPPELSEPQQCRRSTR